MGKLPSFIIAGVQKAATTWLAARLRQHPQVYMPEGEIHFFDRTENWERGVDWYKSHFSRGKGKVCGEKTPDYLWTTCEGVEGEIQDKAERIRDVVPNAKLIVVLREPVARAVSAWFHNMKTGRLPPYSNVNEVFSSKYAEPVRRCGILSKGLYATQLKNYFQVFPSQSMLLLFNETDVKEKPEKTLRQVCSFLGIDEQFPFNRVGSLENTYKPTHPGLAMLARAPEIAVPTIQRIDKHILSRVRNWQMSYPELEADVKLSIQDYYSQEVGELKKMIGSVPQEWMYNWE